MLKEAQCGGPGKVLVIKQIDRSWTRLRIFTIKQPVNQGDQNHKS